MERLERLTWNPSSQNYDWEKTFQKDGIEITSERSGRKPIFSFSQFEKLPSGFKRGTFFYSPEIGEINDDFECNFTDPCGISLSLVENKGLYLVLPGDFGEGKISCVGATYDSKGLFTECFLEVENRIRIYFQKGDNWSRLMTRVEVDEAEHSSFQEVKVDERLEFEGLGIGLQKRGEEEVCLMVKTLIEEKEFCFKARVDMAKIDQCARLPANGGWEKVFGLACSDNFGYTIG